MTLFHDEHLPPPLPDHPTLDLDRFVDDLRGVASVLSG